MPAKGWSKLESDPEYIELIKFLIEKTKDAKSSMNVKLLAEEFKETSGSSQRVECLRARIRIFRSRIHQMNSIDSSAKVRMLVALGAPIDIDLLDKLRNDAHVEVDGNSRITKYIAKDGSLEMDGDHSGSAKRKLGWDRQQQNMNDSLNDSNDGSQDSTTRTPESVRRAAAVEVPNSSKRIRSASPTRFMESEDFAPDDSIGSPESSGSRTPENQLLRQPELEDALEASGSPGSAGASPHQETPIFRSGSAPRASEALLRPKSEANRASNDSEANDAQTPQIKFLETIQSFVSALDMPSLTPLKIKIGKKLRELSPNEKIPNDVTTLAVELLVAKVAHHSVLNLSENVESVSLIQLLCYLKAAILNSKLEGLEMLIEKIQERIRKPTSKDKNIPVEKVASALQDTLNNVGF